ncbi:MAG: flagellin [Alphaproteobacteria bacterium]|nr:flagellin [Alphaproteobacteria bacterium]
MDSIRTNTAATQARNAHVRNNKMLTRVQGELATGSRITDPSNLPGPAGVAFAISADIKTTKAAARNVLQGEAFIQTGTGALGVLQGILEQMADLAATANNGMTLDDAALENLQLEMDQLIAELDNVIGTTKFNGVDVLAQNTLKIQVGTAADTSIEFEGVDLSVATAMSADIVGDAEGAADTIKDARLAVSTAVGNMGAIKTRLDFISRNLATTVQNLQSAQEAFADTDISDALQQAQGLTALVDIAAAMMQKTMEKPTKLAALVQNAR